MACKPWSTREVEYMVEHAREGAEAVAKRLGRSVHAVECQATRYGVSLERRYLCPQCGRESRLALHRVTGLCQLCTAEAYREDSERRARTIREELEAERKLKRLRRERNTWDAQASRDRKALRKLRGED